MLLNKLIQGSDKERLFDMDRESIDAINLEANTDFAKRTLPGTTVIFLLLVISGYISPVLSDNPLLLYGLIAFSFISVVLHIFLLKSIDRQTPVSMKRWKLQLSMLGISTAIYWGVFCGWALVQYGVNEITMVHLFFAVGIGSGATASIFIWKRVAQLYLVIVLFIPAIILIGILESHIALGLGFSFLIYLLFLALQVSRSNDEYWNALINTKQLAIQAIKLEEASKAKSMFLSSMSHELRTPLNAIIGFSQLLEEDAVDEAVKDSSSEILKAGQHLLVLINELLDLSKVESGKMELNINDNDLNEIIKDSVNTIMPAANNGSIKIENKVNLESTCLVKVDPMRFKQIMLNLLSNAIKYNSEKGSVMIDSQLVDKETIKISVCDTGSGLTTEQIENIFQPFERVGADSTQIEGTGLGLGLAKNMVELMGGAIGIESKVGSGSCFWILIPLSKVQDS